MATTFDFETALKQLQSGQALTGENGILTPLIKQLTEAALEGKRPLNTPSEFIL